MLSGITLEQIAGWAAFLVLGSGGTAVWFKKALKTVEITGAETDIVSQLRTEVNRLADQNNKLARTLNSLQDEVIKLKSENAELRAELAEIRFSKESYAPEP